MSLIKRNPVLCIAGRAASLTRAGFISCEESEAGFNSTRNDVLSGALRYTSCS